MHWNRKTSNNRLNFTQINYFSLFSYSVVPKLKSDFHDVFAELEKELAKNPNMAYSEAEDTPLDVVDTLVKGKRKNLNNRFFQP